MAYLIISCMTPSTLSLQEMGQKAKILTCEEKVALITDVFLAACVIAVALLIILANNGVPLGQLNVLNTLNIKIAYIMLAAGGAVIVVDLGKLMIRMVQVISTLFNLNTRLSYQNTQAHKRTQELQEQKETLEMSLEQANKDKATLGRVRSKQEELIHIQGRLVAENNTNTKEMQEEIEARQARIDTLTQLIAKLSDTSTDKEETQQKIATQQRLIDIQAQLVNELKNTATENDTSTKEMQEEIKTRQERIDILTQLIAKLSDTTIDTGHDARPIIIGEEIAKAKSKLEEELESKQKELESVTKALEQARLKMTEELKVHASENAETLKELKGRENALTWDLKKLQTQRQEIETRIKKATEDETKILEAINQASASLTKDNEAAAKTLAETKKETEQLIKVQTQILSDIETKKTNQQQELEKLEQTCRVLAEEKAKLETENKKIEESFKARSNKIAEEYVIAHEKHTKLEQEIKEAEQKLKRTSEAMSKTPSATTPLPKEGTGVVELTKEIERLNESKTKISSEIDELKKEQIELQEHFDKDKAEFNANQKTILEEMTQLRTTLMKSRKESKVMQEKIEAAKKELAELQKKTDILSNHADKLSKELIPTKSTKLQELLTEQKNKTEEIKVLEEKHRQLQELLKENTTKVADEEKLVTQLSQEKIQLLKDIEALKNLKKNLITGNTLEVKEISSSPGPHSTSSSSNSGRQTPPSDVNLEKFNVEHDSLTSLFETPQKKKTATSTTTTPSSTEQPKEIVPAQSPSATLSPPKEMEAAKGDPTEKEKKEVSLTPEKPKQREEGNPVARKIIFSSPQKITIDLSGKITTPQKKTPSITSGRTSPKKAVTTGPVERKEGVEEENIAEDKEVKEALIYKFNGKTYNLLQLNFGNMKQVKAKKTIAAVTGKKFDELEKMQQDVQRLHKELSSAKDKAPIKKELLSVTKQLKVALNSYEDKWLSRRNAPNLDTLFKKTK